MTRIIDITLRFDLDEPVSRARYKAVLGAYAERGTPTWQEAQEGLPPGIPVAKEQNGPQRGPEAPTEAVRVFGDDMETWPEGQCPIHGSASWQTSKFGGMYCTSMASAGQPADKKGRCPLKSKVVYEGRLIP
jgi:hypothetical protein